MIILRPWSQLSFWGKFRVPIMLGTILVGGVGYASYFHQIHSERIDRKRMEQKLDMHRMTREQK